MRHWNVFGPEAVRKFATWEQNHMSFNLFGNDCLRIAKPALVLAAAAAFAACASNSQDQGFPPAPSTPSSQMESQQNTQQSTTNQQSTDQYRNGAGMSGGAASGGASGG